jgi:transposase
MLVELGALLTGTAFFGGNLANAVLGGVLGNTAYDGVKAFSGLRKLLLKPTPQAKDLEKGLYLFFFPPYCSEMNPIEGEWHQLKTHGIAGRMFDNAYDLALAIEQSVEQRFSSTNHTIERFIFNSA